MALMEWVGNAAERKRLQVERAARESQENALLAAPVSRMGATAAVVPSDETQYSEKSDKKVELQQKPLQQVKRASESISLPSNGRQLPHASSTLGNVSGSDLANEVRTILMKQKEAITAAVDAANSASLAQSAATSAAGSETSSSDDETPRLVSPAFPVPPPVSQPKNHVAHPPVAQLFEGLEAVVRQSSNQAQASAQNAGQQGPSASSSAPLASAKPVTCAPGASRKRLRWHALVDSGMGRLGFRTDQVPPEEKDLRRDTVDILREMVDAEISGKAPIQFFGMCTHMAEASSTSDYTHSQIAKFVQLLGRVREAGIDVPTVSTDNSAALLTTNLTHFQPETLPRSRLICALFDIIAEPLFLPPTSPFFC